MIAYDHTSQVPTDASINLLAEDEKAFQDFACYTKSEHSYRFVAFFEEEFFPECR
jgi:hypothetical protein